VVRRARLLVEARNRPAKARMDSAGVSTAPSRARRTFVPTLGPLHPDVHSYGPGVGMAKGVRPGEGLDHLDPLDSDDLLDTTELV
jgi:hypothetical protein